MLQKVKFSIHLLNHHQDINEISKLKFYLCPNDDLVNNSKI